jgi:formylglycine-generating enzyme required for sulfatase activity
LKSSHCRPRHPESFLRHWVDGVPPSDQEDHPVVYVDLDDARAYARWAGK